MSVIKGEDIKKILIIGGGTMGQQIGALSAIHGCDVVIYDIKDEYLDNAKDKIERMLKNFVNWKKITAEQSAAALPRISYTTSTEVAAKNVDIISESVPEDPALKGKIFSEFNKLCPEHAIFTTNTSTLLPSMIAASTGRPEKFLAFHFHDANSTNIVDVMPHPGTSAEAVEAVRIFAERIGQLPIVLKIESNGYVFNAMLTALHTAAITLAANGVAQPIDIDKAWMGVTGMVIGPFGLMDNIGLDTVYKVTEIMAKQRNDAQGLKNAQYIKKEFVEKGCLGRKTKKGIFTYPDPEFARPGFLK